MFDLNVTSTFFCSQPVARAMIARKRGAIVNMSSLAAHNGGGAGASAYSMSKAAVLGLTKAMAKELAPHGIRVNCVAPGLIGETAFHGRFTAPDAFNTIAKGIPLGRAGSPEEVARVVVLPRQRRERVPRRRNDRDQRRRLVQVSARRLRLGSVRIRTAQVPPRTLVDHRPGLSRDGHQLSRSVDDLGARADHHARSEPVESGVRAGRRVVSARPTRSARRCLAGSTIASARSAASRPRSSSGQSAAAATAGATTVGSAQRVPVRARTRRGGQLAGRGEGGGRMVPRARARVRDGHLQQRRRARRRRLSADHRLAAAALRMAGGVPRHGQPRLRVAGAVAALLSAARSSSVADARRSAR